MVGVHWTLHSQRRRSSAFCRPLQSGPEAAVLGLFLERNIAFAFWADSVVSPVHSLELKFSAPRRRVLASRVRTVHDRAFYHPRLHGYCNGTRCVWLCDSGRRLAGLGQQAPPYVVSATSSRLDCA